VSRALHQLYKKREELRVGVLESPPSSWDQFMLILGRYQQLTEDIQLLELEIKGREEK
jgi:hypothetical protein